MPYLPGHATRIAFQRDERGAIAIIFALTLMVLLMLTGLALDVGRAVHAGSKIAAAIDAAVLAGAKGLRLKNMTDDEVRSATLTMFQKNLDELGLSEPTINRFSVAIDRAKGSVEVDVDAEIPTILGKIAGINVVKLPRSSGAIFENRDIEVGVQLDVTGSMSGPKIADLKVATKDLVDILIPDDASLLAGRKVRIGYAPYAAGVNAGVYASLINGNVSAPNTCVYERSSPGFQNADAAPTGAAVLKTKLDLPSAGNCSGARILPLTSDKSALKATVDSYTTGGSTAGHLGTAFAWYLLSPEWSSIWPASSRPDDYGSGKAIKVAILMTDGEYNTVGGSNTTADRGRSSQFAVDTCAAMKAKGILVYTVGFKLNQADAINTLRSCASNTYSFYEAQDGSELRSAFRAIAEDIAKLRLSK